MHREKSVDKWSQNGLKPGSNPGSNPFLRVRASIFFARPEPPALGPRSGKVPGDCRVLEAIFYIRLMPASIDPTTFKSSDFGRVKRRELRQRSVLALGGSSVTRRQLRKIQNSAALNDAQGKLGGQMEPK